MKKKIKIVNGSRDQKDYDGKYKYEDGSENNYELPILDALTLGGARAPRKSDLQTELVYSDDDGYLYVEDMRTYYDLPEASETELGGVKADLNDINTLPAKIDLDGKLYVEDKTIGLEIPDEYVLPAATIDALGGVKADAVTTQTEPVYIGDDNKLYVEDMRNTTTYELPAATETELGGVKASVKTTQTLEAFIDETDNKLYVEDKTIGLEIPDEYVLPAATTDALGGVKADAVTTQTEPVYIGDDNKLYVEDMRNTTTYELPAATETELGGVKASVKTTQTLEAFIDETDNKLYVEDKTIGLEIPDEYVLPAATTDTLGGIKADTNTGNTLPALIGTDNKLYVEDRTIGLEIPDVTEINNNIDAIVDELEDQQTQIDTILETTTVYDEHLFRFEIDPTFFTDDGIQNGYLHTSGGVWYSAPLVQVNNSNNVNITENNNEDFVSNQLGVIQDGEVILGGFSLPLNISNTIDLLNLKRIEISAKAFIGWDGSAPITPLFGMRMLYGDRTTEDDFTGSYTGFTDIEVLSEHYTSGGFDVITEDGKVILELPTANKWTDISMTNENAGVDYLRGFLLQFKSTINCYILDGTYIDVKFICY